MARATIYRRVNGMPIQKAMGHVGVVQTALRKEADKGANRARSILKAIQAAEQNEDTDRAYIEQGKGDMDYYVRLCHPSKSNSRGANTAMSIEFGRAGGSKEVVATRDGTTYAMTARWGAAPAHHILHRAFGQK